MKTANAIPGTADLRISRVSCTRTAKGWWVHFPVVQRGKRCRKHKRFASGAAAHAFAQELKGEITQHGERFGSLPDEVRNAYRIYCERAFDLTAKGVDVPDFETLVSNALDAIVAELAPGELTVAEGVEKFLESRKSAMSHAGYHSLRTRLRQLARILGDRAMRSLTTPQIDDCLVSLTRKRKPKGAFGEAGNYELSAHARNHYRAALATFFRHATELGWVSTNPVKAVKRARVSATPEVFAPEQAALVMLTALNREPHVLSVLALQMFAGLRFTEAARMDLSGVMSAEASLTGSFQVPAPNGGARNVPVSDALTSWLAASPITSGPAWDGSMDVLRNRIEKVLLESGVNTNFESSRMTCLRHRLQLTGSFDQVAAEGGVRYALLEALSRLPDTSEAAEKFFQLNPRMSSEMPSLTLSY